MPRIIVRTAAACLSLAVGLSLAPLSRAKESSESPAAIAPEANFAPGPEYADDVRMFQGISGLERAPGGRLWATWYGGGVTEDRHNYIMLVTSGDDGKTWSDLKLVIDPDRVGPVRAFDPCPWIDPSGKLWLFWAQATRGGGGDPFTFAMTTANPDDENPKWTKPRRIHDGVMMCKPTVTGDGTWLLPTAIWHRENSCRVVASTDEGKSWQLRGTANVPAPKDRNCDEPMIVEREDGSLWQLVRTRYGIGESVSTDAGKTWSPVTPWDVAHPTSRFFIRQLHSGNLLLVKHGPLQERTGRSHLTAYLSEDDGKTWQGGLLIDERPGVSYPDGAESKEGVIYITYDFDRLREKTIYMASFTEEDILAKKTVSDPAQMRVIINQATGVNPKVAAKTRPPKIEFAANKDGKELLQGKTELESETGDVVPVERGTLLFTDRRYKMHDIPEVFADKRFIRGSIDGIRAKSRTAGPVFVVTPSPRRNSDSQADALLNQGFSKANLPEFLLFGETNAPGNVCTTYQKLLKVGEILEVGKWGVVVY